MYFVDGIGGAVICSVPADAAEFLVVLISPYL